MKDDRVSLIKELAKSLVKTQSLKFGVFKLTSGKMSSYYIDLRLVPSYPQVFKRIIDMYANIIVNEIGLSNFDVICGIPTSGLVFASALAYSLEKPLIYIRKDVKSHGTQKSIEGFLKPGDRVLLVDDLITTGSSLISSSEMVLGEGGVIKDAVVLVDREEGGITNLRNVGINVHYVAKVSELAKDLYENNIIDEEEYNAVLKQIEKG
ncbi:MAG: orotate phosphoribosyltransferase [Nitrososphaeria archaeon]|nr:orotate phosphoribosyltransferase [Nitrososphaeria archaeon]